MGDIIKNLYEAKTELSSLVERAAKGEEIIIAKNGEPMARLVPYESTKGRRVPGCGKGKIWISDDFDAPLPDDILATLEEPIGLLLDTHVCSCGGAGTAKVWAKASAPKFAPLIRFMSA
jgi:prevent-host-death family protein